MRIISDFHDYYDVGMQNGIDPQLPYRRFRREEKIDPCRSGLFYPSYFDDYCVKKYKVLFLGFAGKIYPFFEYANDSHEMAYLFDFDKIDFKYFDDTMSDIIWHCRRSKSRKMESRQILAWIKNDLKTIVAYKDKKELLDLFDKFKTAIFVHRLEHTTIIINERLNQYGFQKVLPPMQAFQELEMYVGSYLTRPAIEEPPIPDKIKAEIHGFDKYSFRKDKKLK